MRVHKNSINCHDSSALSRKHCYASLVTFFRSPKGGILKQAILALSISPCDLPKMGELW
jgi:hypothetical protein